MLLSGVLGMVTYLAVSALGELFDTDDIAEVEVASGALEQIARTAQAVGKAALFLFIYLEILDASVSFDGAVGAGCHHLGSSPDRDQLRRRGDVHPFADGLPGAQGDPGPA